MSLAASRLLLVGFVAVLTFVTFRSPRRAVETFRKFIFVPAAPLNLAVFRIVVFAAVLQKLNLGTAVWLAHIPEDLMAPPWGMRTIVDIVPLTPEWVWWAGWLLGAVCTAGILGILTRTSAALAALFGLFVLGVPQCVGKVSHYNHLVWFLAVLAASPCGDALSVDALLRSKSRTATGFMGTRRADLAYGFPLRVVWLTIGIIYFFPGFWKVWTSGLEWVLGDNLPNLVLRYGALIESDRALWLATVPMVLKAGGAAVLLFEMGFIFALFWPRFRFFAMGSGVFFHLANWYALDILFHPLLACYVVFVDWAALVRRGQKDRPAVVSSDAKQEQLRAAIPRTLILVCTVVIVGAVYAGARGITQGWPFACYPTFDEIAQPYMRTVTLDRIDDSAAIPIDLDPLRHRLGAVRWERWIAWMVETQDEEARSGRLTAFAQWCARESGLSGKDGMLRLSTTILDVSQQEPGTVSHEVLIRCALGRTGSER